MKALFSHIENPFAIYPSNHYLEFTALANYFAKKQGFETIFFGDEKSLKNFKNIEFNYTERLSTDRLRKFPECFWAAGKLLAIDSMNEPCIHIDNDLFLTKPIPENFLKNDIVCFHDEKFAMNNAALQLEKLQELFHIKPKEAEGFPSISYNCGIMGGQDLQTIKKSINIIFDFITYYALHIDSINLKYINNPNVKTFFYPPVLIEQIWFYQVIKSFGKEITPLIHINNWDENFKKVTMETGYLHLMGQKKFFKEHVKKTLLNKNIKY